MINLSFPGLFAICLFAHVLRTIYSVMKYRKKLNPRNKVMFLLMFTVMTILWMSFFLMCDNDITKLNLPEVVKICGFILSIAGLFLFIVPLVQLRGLENIDRLVTSGVYAFIRHPMYLGFIFWVIGYPVAKDVQLSFFSSLIWIPNILYWRSLEEKELLVVFKEYAAYKKRTIF